MFLSYFGSAVPNLLSHRGGELLCAWRLHCPQHAGQSGPWSPQGCCPSPHSPPPHSCYAYLPQPTQPVARESAKHTTR